MRRFGCHGCGRGFSTDTSEEEMAREYFEEYGHSQEESEEGNVSLCDDCHKKLMDIKSKK